MKLKIKLKYLLMIFLPLVFLASCDLIDPTEVENPAITEDKLFEDASGGATPLIVGLRYAFSDALTKTTIYTEIASDNYQNIFTFLTSIADNPRGITPNEQYLGDNRQIYMKLQIFLALSNFGIDVILPADALANDEQRAETHFFKGMALLMLSENFAAFPIVENGAAVRSEDAVLLAIEEFNTAYNLLPSGENAINCKLALARAYRFAGNKAQAVAEAQNALGMSTDYIYNAQYDAINLTNELNLYAVRRTAYDLQPLPRLDFLDPKYTLRDDPIAALKSEEAYLILAEAELSNNNLSTAKNYMADVINLALSRTTQSFRDTDQRPDRPNNSDFKVKADASSPEISGLLFARSGNTVTNYPVSGTSLTVDFVNGLTTKEELYHALYLLRQEIFFSEGRRMSDLGIRLPVMQRQIDANPNFNAGDYGTVVIVPEYIPQGKDMDGFTVDETAGVVTMLYDMNKIIVQNISLVSPFE